jgi:carbonic anhydrase
MEQNKKHDSILLGNQNQEAIEISSLELGTKEADEPNNPSFILKNLVEGNNSYAITHCSKFELLKQKQTPKITLVTCCDSRVPQDLFNVESLNNIFTVRNIGNQFRNSEGSVKYPIMHLKTPLLIIMGHTGCGAIKASLSDYREEDDTIQKEVIGLVNSIRIANQTTDVQKIPDEDKRLAVYAQVNVDHQISKLLTDYQIKNRVSNGQLDIIGMIFDIHGIFGDQAAHAYITNINGTTSVKAMKKQKVASRISKEFYNSKLRRL